MKEDILEALKYLCEKERGYIHELNIDPKLFEQFKIVGFVHSGYSLKYRTWSITELGKQYYREIK